MKPLRCPSPVWLLVALLPWPLLAPPAARALLQPQHGAAAVCVVAPRVEPVEEADAAGVVPVARPRLVVIEPLQELRIERAGAPPWRRLAPLGAALPMPLDWPTLPIQPGETVLVRLRPQQVPADAFAHVLLVGASRSRMQASTRLIATLGGSAPAWLAAIEAALRSGDVPLAWALLFASESPAAPELDELRAEVVRRGCAD